MPVDIGNQVITVKFFDPVDSDVANRIGIGVRKVGIYSGGYLTKVDDVTATLSTFDCEIGDGTYQIRGLTGVSVNVTVSPAIPYVVIRWVYTGSAADDYMEFLGVSSVLPTDIVVAKCNFSGSILNGFDYTLRTNPNVFDLFLKVESTVPAGLYVRVRAGKVTYGNYTSDIVDQLSPLFSVPGVNSRIDLVQINAAGAVIITQGTPAGSPVAPDYGGLVTLAEVTLTTGQASITTANIRDVRSYIGGGSSLPSIIGNANKFLRVNSAGTATEWAYPTYAP